jgi:hypothetical protein
MSKLLASIVTPLAACLAFVGASTWSPAQTVPKYSAEYLGESLGATTLSHSGQLIGNATIGGNTRGWVASSGSPLVPLPLPPGFISSNANDINAAGVIVGRVGPFYSPEFQEQAVAWFPNGAGGYTIQMLGKLPGHIGSNAVALNNVGDIVGYSTDGTFRLPVWFTAPGGILDLNPTGVFDPQSINDKRVLVDRSANCKRLDLNTMIAEPLGMPPGSYGATAGYAINESGQVAGMGVLTSGTQCPYTAIRYTNGIGWQVFSGCGSGNGASDLNDVGDIIMRLNVASYAYFDKVGAFPIEDLIENTVGHWSVINAGGVINNRRQIAVAATNATTHQTGILLLTPKPFNGVDSYGSGTPGCEGPHELSTNSSPTIGNASFALLANNAPPSALGLGLITDAQGSGGDPFGLGIAFLVDPILATQVIALDIHGDAGGAALAVVPIPPVPALAGSQYYVQAFFAWPAAACAPPPSPFGLSSSNGLKLTIQ